MEGYSDGLMLGFKVGPNVTMASTVGAPEGVNVGLKDVALIFGICVTKANDGATVASIGNKEGENERLVRGFCEGCGDGGTNVVG
jgi:hypothetical protein